jgi:hypothetical protein
MSVTLEDKLTTLNRLIGEAEGRCVEQTAFIFTLLVKDEPVGQAIDNLKEVEDLLMQMRAERAALASQAPAS